MRKQFFEGLYDEARLACPWACDVVECEGGYMCFESHADCENWLRQV